MSSSRSYSHPAMRPASALAILVLLPSLLTGCLKFETTVRVKPDGSGTITERFLMSKDIVEMFAEMAPEGEAFKVLDEAQLRADAEGYGAQVRFLSAEPLETDFGQGYLARYGFMDINQLEVDTNAGRKLPDNEAGAGGDEQRAPELVRFTLESTGPAELLVHWPIEEPAAGTEQEPAEETAAEAPGAEELEMMKEFLGGMHMAMHIEVAGEIIETNATYREGARVTLMDFAFDDLLSDETALQAMAQQEPESLSDLKLLLEKIPGLKLEVEHEIRIKFE